MKNASTLNSQGKNDSPKTPGGISRSLLTPCRRVGLSRNFRKNGPLPFVSPLANSSEVKVEKREPRKRKKCDDDEDSTSELPLKTVHTETGTSGSPLTTGVHTEAGNAHLTSETAPKVEYIETTPSRNVSIPRRKKSKSLLAARKFSKDSEPESPKTPTTDAEIIKNNVASPNVAINPKNDTVECNENAQDISLPVCTTSKSKAKQNKLATTNKLYSNEVNKNIKQNENLTDNVTPKQRSPENLTKECIVVIQKKIFKKDKSIEKGKAVKDMRTPISQSVFDSDSDDVPLKELNKEDTKVNAPLKEINKEDMKTEKNPVIVLDDDDDFDETHKVIVKKLVDKTTSIGGLRSDSTKKKDKDKSKLPQKRKVQEIELKMNCESKPSSQSSDDDDFIIDNRKTILIRKCYDKVTKPSKAKSTGSITQKDIDVLKSRIEMKKKLLLAKAVSKDTEELRDLIKKWQKGCQDALMELMELMKNKFPDKQNMNYSEILQTFKIPSALVGYDEDNDCFSTPTDESVILSKFN